MLVCFICRKKFSEENKACPECFPQEETLCWSCRSHIESFDRFCRRCGTMQIGKKFFAGDYSSAGKCWYCRREVPAGEYACSCGVEQYAPCKNMQCGHDVYTADRFCKHCGAEQMSQPVFK